MNTELSTRKPNRQERRRAAAIDRAAEPRDRFVREPECEEISGLSRSTRFRLERAGKFPRRRKISANASGWLASEIAAWLAARAAA